MVEIAMGLYQSATYLEDLERCAAYVNPFDGVHGSSVLVTGSTGLIGSFLVDALLAANVRVVAACRSKEKALARFRDCPFGMPEIVNYDAALPIEGIPPVNYVVHAASNAHPAAMMSDPVGTVVTNVVGTANLLNWCEVSGVARMVYVSSGEVYGQAETGVASFTEEYQGYVNPMVPRSCYPVAKRAAENLCASWNGATTCVIARLCHTFGPTATVSDVRAASEFSRKAAAGENIILRSKGGQFRSWLHVSDTAAGILTALGSGERGVAYNVASLHACTTIAGLAEAFADAGDVDVVYELEDQEGQSSITRQVLDSSRLEKLGWSSCLGLKDAASRTVRSLKESLESC